MKKLLFTLLFFSLAVANAQINLVPNPSFEDTANCPVGAGEISKALGWYSYSGSPDYFNSCSSPGFVSVPNNFGGYQQAASGNAYVGLITVFMESPTTREFIGRQLLLPLNIGTKYFASFKVALSLGTLTPSNCATDKMGVNFSTIPFDASHPASITNNAKAYASSIITDTLNWTRVFGSFIADSAYEYIMLGNFFDNNNTDTIKFSNSFENIGYYYVDDICVSVDSSFALNYFYTGIGENTEMQYISIFPNPATNYVDIKISNYSDPFSLSLHNVLGQVLVRTENINASNARIDIADLPNGIYFLQIIYKNKIFNNKLKKQIP